MRYYKLIDPMDTSVRVYLPHREGNVIKHESFILYPGKKYSEYIDDDVFLSALKDAYKDIPYTDERKEALDRAGARYEMRRCAPCQGRVKKLRVWIAEVV